MLRSVLVISCLLSAPCYAGQIGIIIGKDSGSLRRIVAPDNDAQLHQQNWAGPGETMIVANDTDEITGKIAEFTGKTPMISLSAVVDPKGNVLSVIVADPRIDKSPDGQLISAFPGVKAGHIFDINRRVFVSPAHEEKRQIQVGNQIIDETLLMPTEDVPETPLDAEPSHRLIPLHK